MPSRSRRPPRPYPGERPPLAAGRSARAAHARAGRGLGWPAFALTASAVAFAGSAGATMATAQEERVDICHFTGSVTNPYVELRVPASALAEHRGHRLDLIPAPDTGCPESTVTPTPTPEPPETPTPTPTREPTPVPTREPTPDPTREPAPAPTAVPAPPPPPPAPPAAAAGVEPLADTFAQAQPQPPANLANTGGEALVLALLGSGLCCLGFGLRVVLR